MSSNPEKVKYSEVIVYGKQDNITVGWNNAMRHIARNYPNGIIVVEDDGNGESS